MCTSVRLLWARNGTEAVRSLSGGLHHHYVHVLVFGTHGYVAKRGIRSRKLQSLGSGCRLIFRDIFFDFLIKGRNTGRNTMRKIMTMIFGMLYIVVLTVTADAASQKKPSTNKKSCEKICDLRTNGLHDKQYGRCLDKCKQNRM